VAPPRGLQVALPPSDLSVHAAAPKDLHVVEYDALPPSDLLVHAVAPGDLPVAARYVLPPSGLPVHAAAVKDSHLAGYDALPLLDPVVQAAVPNGLYGMACDALGPSDQLLQAAEAKDSHIAADDTLPLLDLLVHAAAAGEAARGQVLAYAAKRLGSCPDWEDRDTPGTGLAPWIARVACEDESSTYPMAATHLQFYDARVTVAK
jgi:hypothetical protein